MRSKPSVFLACGDIEHNYCLVNGDTAVGVSVPEGGQYYATYYGDNGCVGSDTMTLTVNDPAPPVFTTDSIVNICEGDTIVVATVNPWASYTWSENGSFYSSDPTVTLTDSIELLLEVADANGCETEANLYAYSRPNPTPMITRTWTSAWTIRLEADSGYQAYEWNNGETDSKIIVNNNDTFSVTVTDEYGCQGVATYVTIAAGVDDLVSSKISMYPNPTDGLVQITWPEAWVGNSEAVIMDQQGKVVMPLLVNRTNEQIDLQGLSAGIYLIKADTPEGVASLTLIKQ